MRGLSPDTNSATHRKPGSLLALTLPGDCWISGLAPTHFGMTHPLMGGPVRYPPPLASRFTCLRDLRRGHDINDSLRYTLFGVILKERQVVG